ncbi:MAG: GAF domain-containing protein [Anaerolineales bacterium]|nr:GAF domain-containing protein [Anaerolineales bacterium]
MLISNFVLFSFQRRQIVQNAQAATTTLSNTIKSNLRHAMLNEDWKMVNDILQAVVAEGSVDTVRILNARSTVSASSIPSEVGIQFDRAQPACQLCHASASPTTDKTTIFTASSGHQAMLNVNLLMNDAECMGCHEVENKVLGVLLIETPLITVYDQLTTGFWRTALLAITTFALSVGLMAAVLKRYVLKPIDGLGKGMAEISAGNLDYQVQPVSQDELGSLAQSFDTMREQLKALHIEMERRNQELSVLNEIALTLSQSLDLQRILEIALETVADKLGVETAFLFLFNEETGCLTLCASQGASEALCREIEQRRQHPAANISGQVARTSQTYFAANMEGDSRFTGLWDELHNRSYVNVLLRSKGKAVGTMVLVSFAGRQMTARDVSVVESVGNEIGIAIDNALLMAETHRSAKESMTLFQLGTQVSGKLALSEVLDAVAKAAQELLIADIGLVGLLDEERQEVVIEATAGTQAGGFRFIGTRIPVHEKTPGSALVEGQPLIAEVNDHDQPFIHDSDLIASEHIAAYLAVPLRRGEHFFGLVEVITRQRRRFLQRDAQLLMHLAHHVVVAIENAQLYRQLRYLATLEERDRLAREMHDELAQALGYLNVKASITNDLLSGGRVDQAQESLMELKKVAKFVYTDVREAIFNLRTTVSFRAGLLPTLQDYLAEYRAHYGVETRLVVENDGPSEISPEAASQLLRIIQEALTNVRKHAAAKKVLIRYNQNDSQVCISIEDDGQGFEVGRAIDDQRQHFGLQIMGERAESIGGGLEIDSRPGRGTRVIVRAPLAMGD